MRRKLVKIFRDDLFIQSQDNSLCGIMKTQNQDEERRWATECALKLEEQLHLLYKSSKEYCDKARSLVFNLTDPKNQELKKRILLQELTPRQVITSDARKLASKEQLKEIEETVQQAVLGARSDYMAMRVMEGF